MLKVGICAVQGAVSEHTEAVERALTYLKARGLVVEVRCASQLDGVNAFVLPGGESTTISKALHRFGMAKTLTERAESGELAILGTCAGMILLAREGDSQVAKTETRLLALMDMEVGRNAFGRQKDSFEAPVRVEGLDSPYPAVFIRSPVIRRTWGRCRVLASHEGAPVMARQENLWGLSFHPELTPDPRVHAMFLESVL